MAYNPLTDFLALVRNVGGQASIGDMPGLDYVVAAMARAGMFRLSVSQTAPTTNQASTVWLQPSLPSWVAESTVRLWDVTAGGYSVATPALWAALFAAMAGQAFQSVGVSAAVVGNTTTMLAIQRANPATTALVLPSVASRSSSPLQIVDWSTLVVNHVITLTPAAGETIMQLTSFALLSSAAQLSGVTLYPSLNLSGWVIAP